MNIEAKLRGNCMEGGVADFALALLRRMVPRSTPIDMGTQGSLPLPASDRQLYRSHNRDHGGGAVLNWLDKEFVSPAPASAGSRPTPTMMAGPDRSVIQVQHQMICAELDWAVIAYFDQHFKCTYPVLRDQALIDVMLESLCRVLASCRH